MYPVASWSGSGRPRSSCGSSRSSKRPSAPRQVTRAISGSSALPPISLVWCSKSWRAAGSPPRPDVKAIPDERFRPVVSYMREHLGEKLTRRKARAPRGPPSGVFRSAVSRRLWHAAHAALARLRLRRRAVAARGDRRYAGEDRARVGLGDAAYLSRVFRAKYGKAPGSIAKARKARRRATSCRSCKKAQNVQRESHTRPWRPEMPFCILVA